MIPPPPTSPVRWIQEERNFSGKDQTSICPLIEEWAISQNEIVRYPESNSLLTSRVEQASTAAMILTVKIIKKPGRIAAGTSQASTMSQVNNNFEGLG